jgi:hypothetical protein
VTAAACAELAQLTPMLAPALRRDTTGSGRYGRLEPTLTLFNTDVLAVRIMLLHHVPATAMRACQLVNEPWPTAGRTYGACLTALPRLAARMQAIGLAARVTQLDTITRGWVRQTKLALGLRTPDLPLDATCPECQLGDPPHGQLLMAGSEAFINTGTSGPPLNWVTSGRVYCPQCSAYWVRGEWELLIRVLSTSGQRPQPVTNIEQAAG